jgi:hypothetical protein
VKDRGLRHERDLDRRLAAGMLDRVALPKRVTWFVEPSECPPVTTELTARRMRDIVVTLAVFGSLPFIIKRPWIGILVWSWLGFMNPHRLAWGFATTLPFAMAVAITTILAMLLSKEEKKIPVDAGNGAAADILDVDAGHDHELLFPELPGTSSSRCRRSSS